MGTTPISVLAFGEVIWDIFEGIGKMGGAPFNFCAHLVKLGTRAGLLSAVGKDELGSATIQKIRAAGVDDGLVSFNRYPTGVCRVTCDPKGQPSYDLADNMAYDHILLDENIVSNIRKKEFDVFYFGTLAQRGEASRDALVHLLGTCRFRDIFCDLNLRQPFYDDESIRRCLEYSTILKLNREESRIIGETFLRNFRKYEDSEEYYRQFSVRLAQQFDLKIVILTLDRNGAIVYDRSANRHAASGLPKSRAVSTVGAGDSFSACFLHNYLNHADIAVCVARAGILSDYVVTQVEAVPGYPDDLLSQIR